MKKINHWINGKNVAGADYFHTTNPATGEVLAEVASGGEAEINQAVAAAKEAFPKWANLPMKERARLMRRLGDLIDQNVPEIAAMETADTGLPIHQTKNVLIPRASHNFEFFAEVCQQMNGKTYPVRALDAALFTIFSINGERCTAGSRIFIQQSIYPEFVKRFAERANRLRVGDPTDPNTQVGALITKQHWEKVSGYIRLGIEEGATLLAGGADKPSDLPAHLKAGNFLRPTVLAEVASGGEAEINQAVAAAKEAFPKWANLPMKERARLMRRLGDLIDQNVPEIAAMETADTGLPIHQTKNVLIPRASHNFEFFAEVCQQMNGKTYPVDDKMLNYTLVQPVGVCALVSPWNVPFMTATWKVAPCLALGNTAVLKMSELSPLTADRLGELALEAGIPAGVLNVVQGYGATAGDALVRHHDVRAVSFTGGTATGRNIMKNAGLKKYSMELGGKSPVLIFEDADIARALDAALFTIFSINGERCTAGSRIFIQQSIYPEFVKRFAERANRLRVPISSARLTPRCSPSSRSTANAAPPARASLFSRVSTPSSLNASPSAPTACAWAIRPIRIPRSGR